MKVIVSIDSFKGSISSMEAGMAVKRGILLADPSAEVVVKPLADGGEGTVSALVEGLKGHIEEVIVSGPLSEPVHAQYGLIPDKKLAVIEMSQAAGITLIPKAKLNPLYTTTYGVGEMIKHALNKGYRDFIIGIGGSATNDGGAGMLQALGFDLLDDEGNQIPVGAVGLKKLVKIEATHIPAELSECTFKIACDVNNPLYGDQGSSKIFGPQKGATAEMVEELDQFLIHYSQVAQAAFPDADPYFPGVGAAGGLGFAFHTFLPSYLESGIDIILEITQLESLLPNADLLITGEGRLDYQTAMGKAPVGVAKLGKKFGKTVIAFAGSVTEGAQECNRHGIDAFFPILREITSLETAMTPSIAEKNLTETTEQVIRLFNRSEF